MQPLCNILVWLTIQNFVALRHPITRGLSSLQPIWPWIGYVGMSVPPLQMLLITFRM